MFRLAAALLAGALPFSAVAAERGCDKFAWPLAADRQLLEAPDKASLPAGAALDRLPVSAVVVPLQELGAARFDLPPERAPKTPASFAGLVRIGGLAQAGTYQVTLSADAWIDAVQDGALVRPVAHTGALDCPGVRKSVRFNLAAKPLVFQFSGAAVDSLTLVLRRVPAAP